MRVKEGIFWTGHIDWKLRSFHGYLTPLGSTYNAYVIVDQKPAVIDTVKSYGFKDMLKGLKRVVDPEKIEYIISNHTEMDHSGSIKALLDLCPKATVVCSPKGKEGLTRHFKKDWNFKVVTSGEELSLGGRTLRFFPVPMVHWPDSMVTYCPQEKILFSNDAFGQHFASDYRFADEANRETIFKEATKYYANIVLPYGAQVLKALDALSGLDIEMICASHGLIWRTEENIKKIVSLYRKWASHQADSGVVIVYDSMWHSTETMAFRLAQITENAGIPVKLFNLQATHISDIIPEVMLNKCLMVGTPALNNQVLPTVGAFLIYLKGLKPKNRLAFTFGSYGWSKKAFLELEVSLKEAGMELVAEGKYFRYIPEESELSSLAEAVHKIKEVFDER